MTEKKNKAPIWAAIALALGFTGGNLTGVLSTGETVSAAPIYSGDLSWALAYNGRAVLRVKAYSDLGFPTYSGAADLNLPPALKKEILALKKGGIFRGALITADRAVVRIDDDFFTAATDAPKTRAFVENNLASWCKDTAGLCEPPKGTP